MQPAMERLTGSGQPRALATTSRQVMVDSIDGSTPLPGAEDEDPLYIPGHGHQAPLAANLIEPAQQELSEAQDRLDDAEYRLSDDRQRRRRGDDLAVPLDRAGLRGRGRFVSRNGHPMGRFDAVR